MGLILDIISIPWKYNLYQVLTDDLESGYFPNKSQVKTSVESFMISFHSVCLAILILLNSTSFVHANHLSMCEKFLIIIKLFCVNVAVDPPRYPTRILLPLSKICYERIRAFYYSLPWNTIVIAIPGGNVIEDYNIALSGPSQSDLYLFFSALVARVLSDYDSPELHILNFRYARDVVAAYYRMDKAVSVHVH